MLFNFSMPVKVIFGEGRVKEISSMVPGQEVMIVTDRVLSKLGMADRLKEHLKYSQVTVFDEVEPNPECKTINAAVDLARKNKISCVIGLGGGSSMDAAKAVSALISNEGKLEDYWHGMAQFANNRVMLIEIPTTAGTGSEVTNVGVFSDKEKGIKKPMVTDVFYADAAVVDPELTYLLPARVTASTGFDAFCHAVESYWAKSSQPFSDALSLYAARMILKNLKKAFDYPGDKEARVSMAMAATLAGVAFNQTRTTAMHAISFPITNRYGVDHGSACAITLVPCILYNYPAAKEKMEALISFCGYKNIKDFSSSIQEQMEYTGMPVRLSQVGIKAGDIPYIAETSMNANIIRLNPREFDAHSLTELLEGIL